MDMQALMPRPAQNTLGSDKKKKLPCCGKKKKNEPWLEGTLNTEYRKEFIDKEIPVERVRPKQNGIISAGPFDGATTNKADFVPFQVTREPMIKPSHSQAVENLPFAGDSSYAKDFGPKEVTYNRVRPNNAYEPNAGQFYGDTTYGGDFKQQNVPQPRQKMVQGSSMGLTGAAFEGVSNYKDNFVKQAVARTAPIGPKPSSDILPKGGFDGATMYTASFVPKEIQVVEQHRPQDARPMSRGGWYGGAPSTEYRGQFFDKEVPQVEPAKALKGSDIMARGPFDGTTTNKADFLPYAVSREQPIKPQHAMHDDKLPFTATSSYADAFVGKGVPYQRVRPNNAYEPNAAPFEGVSTAKAAYLPYGAMPAIRAVPNRSTAFGKESGPFEGASTYKSNFTRMPAPRTQPFKNVAQPIQTGPFDGRTTYGADFVEKEIPVKEPDCRVCDSCEEEEDDF